MINGVLNVWKEAGFTSHDVVAKLRGILHQKKIGHTFVSSVMEYIFCVLRSICVLLVGICATIRLITTITARTITVIIEE